MSMAEAPPILPGFAQHHSDELRSIDETKKIRPPTGKQKLSKTCNDAVSVVAGRQVFVTIGTADYPIPTDSASKIFAAVANRLLASLGEPVDTKIAWAVMGKIATLGKYKSPIVLSKSAWDAMKRIADIPKPI